MNTYQIWDILANQEACTSKYFLGVYSSDNLPPPIKDIQFIVCNEDSSDKKGSHWISIFLRKQRNGKYYGEYYDSFGRKPLKANIRSYLHEHCGNNWIYNN